MLLVIDSANVEKIKRLIDLYPIDGVTTNPSLIVKEKKPLMPLLHDIRAAIGTEKDLFVQVLANKADEMVEEARILLDELGSKLIIKVPATEEGIKAIKLLTQSGIRTMATTIYTPLQALIAAKAGAAFVAPYVNRIDNLTGNGINTVKEIVRLFDVHALSCKVLAASFKNVQQIHKVALEGAHGVTAPPELIEASLVHPVTEANVQTFAEEWKAFYGNSCENIYQTI